MRRGRGAVERSLKTSVIRPCAVNSVGGRVASASLSCAVSRVRVRVVQCGDEGSHGRSDRHGHTMGCVHDETGSWGSGADPQDIGDPFVSSQQWVGTHRTALSCRHTG